MYLIQRTICHSEKKIELYINVSHSENNLPLRNKIELYINVSHSELQLATQKQN